MKILVIGRCWFNGYHTVVQLLENGFNITIIDNVLISSGEPINRVLQMAGLKSSVSVGENSLLIGRGFIFKFFVRQFCSKAFK